MQPPYSTDYNSMNKDIMEGAFDTKLLNKVLTLYVYLHQKLPVVTNCLVEVIDKQILETTHHCELLYKHIVANHNLFLKCGFTNKITMLTMFC